MGYFFFSGSTVFFLCSAEDSVQTSTQVVAIEMEISLYPSWGRLPSSSLTQLCKFAIFNREITELDLNGSSVP